MIGEIMTTKQILKLNDAYIKAENNLMNAVRKLENYGGECECREGNTIAKFIREEGQWDEIEILCLDCGGMCEATDYARG